MTDNGTADRLTPGLPPPGDLTPDVIAKACGVPLQNAQSSWPRILSALHQQGIASLPVQISAAATVAVETGSFLPIRERLANPEKQPDLARSQARYLPFSGRGFVQITWEKNYRLFSSLVGVDLIAQPELACDPDVAARILAAFFKVNRVDLAAQRSDWRAVRRIVNGGYNGWDRFNACVLNLLGTRA